MCMDNTHMGTRMHQMHTRILHNWSRIDIDTGTSESEELSKEDRIAMHMNSHDPSSEQEIAMRHMNKVIPAHQTLTEVDRQASQQPLSYNSIISTFYSICTCR